METVGLSSLFPLLTFLFVLVSVNSQSNVLCGISFSGGISDYDFSDFVKHGIL